MTLFEGMGYFVFFSPRISRCQGPTFGRRRILHAAGFVGGLALLAGFGGCDKAVTISEVQQAVTNRVEEVKQVAASAGQMQLQLDGKPVQTSACYGTIYRLEAPLQSVFQVTSYNDPTGESFPSVFARAFVSDVGEIAPGKQLEAQVYIQENPNSSVWESIPGEPVELKITGVTNGVCEGEIAGPIANSDDGLRKMMSGTFSGSLSQTPSK